MKKIVFLTLLLLTTSCTTTPIVKFVRVQLPIPVHQQLPVLTPEELKALAPKVRNKMEKLKAILIGNIYKLETIIKENNKGG